MAKPIDASPHRWLWRAANGGGGAVRRLVYFPYAGGDDAPARAIAALLPIDSEVWAVSLPGSGRNMGQPGKPIIQSASLIAAAMAALPPLPTVLWGHSLGALFAFETARAIEAKHPAAAGALIVSGARAPDRLIAQDERMSGWSDGRLLQHLRGLGGLPEGALDIPALMELAIERFRHDIVLREQYEFRPGPPLSEPLIALGGSSDAAVPPDEIAKWAAHAGHFDSRILPGEHFFIMGRLGDLARIVVTAAEAVRRARQAC